MESSHILKMHGSRYAEVGGGFLPDLPLLQNGKEVC